MTCVLVTGGAGYIGSHACLALHRAGFKPVVFDNLSAGNAARVQWGPLVEGDVTDASALDAVFAQYSPVAVMHFAGEISVPRSVLDPEQAYRVNTFGSLQVLSAMRRYHVKHIVFSSTAAVYGIPAEVPIPETAPLLPINPYGHSKLMVEQMLADFSAAYGISYAALRYFNAAGAIPSEGLGYNRPDPFHLIPMVMLAILGKKPALNIFGTDYPTPDGTAVRDYLHVCDLVDAHVLALQHLLAGKPSLTLNLGTSRGFSVREVVETCAATLGLDVPHTFAPRRLGDPPALVADARQAAGTLGWTPRFSDLPTILRDDWAWHQKL